MTTWEKVISQSGYFTNCYLATLLQDIFVWSHEELPEPQQIFGVGLVSFSGVNLFVLVEGWRLGLGHCVLTSGVREGPKLGLGWWVQLVLVSCRLES